VIKALAEMNPNIDVHFMKGKEMLEKWAVLALHPVNHYSRATFVKLSSKLMDLIEKGIYQNWDKWNKIQSKTIAQDIVTKSRKNQWSTVTPLQLNSNISTIFITYILLITACLVVFILEIIYKYFSSMFLFFFQ